MVKIKKILELEDMMKILVIFNKTKLEDEMNGFLCFATRIFQTKSNLYVLFFKI